MFKEFQSWLLKLGRMSTPALLKSESYGSSTAAMQACWVELNHAHAEAARVHLKKTFLEAVEENKPAFKFDFTKEYFVQI